MENSNKLGFGLMRLPHKGLGIDIPQTSQMVDAFLDAGFTYFDTAHVYPGSEDAAKKALVDRHDRDSFTIATKLFATLAPTEKIAKKQFETSLQRTGAGYFDYYLLHTLMESNYKKYSKFGLWDFVMEKKDKGLIKHVGFSFHGGPQLLDELLAQHPEVEFVQLQINYADWENPTITSRANYEIARKYNKNIIVMEPVKGGKLANPPKEIRSLFSDYAPNASFPSWAIRFVASLDGVQTVLSGMSNIEQMNDNLSYMKDFKPLNEEEKAIIRQAQQIMGSTKAIPCTACSYCTKGCPQSIPIPDIFAAMNKRLEDGLVDESVAAYRDICAAGPSAADCISCGQCESVCPQHISIIENLKECHEKLTN